MTAAAFLLVLLSFDGTLSRLDGVLLLLGGVAYTVGLVRASRSATTRTAEAAGASSDTSPMRAGASPAGTARRPIYQILLLVAGLIVIVLGAELLVDGAVSAAEGLGVSETVIGLTIVAIGTSAPELVTTVLSTVRGDRDIAIGNLIGSSIYNIGGVLALTIVVAPHGLPVPDEVLAADLLLLGVVAAVSVPVFVSGARISRLEGGLFLGTYLGYLTWVLLART
jgi:cation:H+ antiporter